MLMVLSLRISQITSLPRCDVPETLADRLATCMASMYYYCSQLAISLILLTKLFPLRQTPRLRQAHQIRTLASETENLRLRPIPLPIYIRPIGILQTSPSTWPIGVGDGASV